MEMCEIVLSHSDIPPNALMGGPTDGEKLKSSMTLFNLAQPGYPFQDILDAFFHGAQCPITLSKMTDMPQSEIDKAAIGSPSAGREAGKRGKGGKGKG
jgi:hypothetical protein